MEEFTVNTQHQYMNTWHPTSHDNAVYPFESKVCAKTGRNIQACMYIFCSRVDTEMFELGWVGSPYIDAKKSTLQGWGNSRFGGLFDDAEAARLRLHSEMMIISLCNPRYDA